VKPSDRAHLITGLRNHVAKMAAELRANMIAPGRVRLAAQQLHQDERVAEDYEIWTDLLSRRVAVLWVLKTVYLRVLEDRRLFRRGRLFDGWTQMAFEYFAPRLGASGFLRWTYIDISSGNGGVPELFSPQPAEFVVPTSELSADLIEFWRYRDPDTNFYWNFADERFDGELMGDLYQELDPVVKERYALCQTPDFIRQFILDRTLTPAIEEFGADQVRLLDPACGSGHFLIDGLKRLVAATTAMHSDWDRERVVQHALDRVVGIDLNDYACALARVRLIMTAAEMVGMTKISDAAQFHPHVYWADGLEQVEREERSPFVQLNMDVDMPAKEEEKPIAALTRSEVRAVLRKVFEKKFHAVVANPRIGRSGSRCGLGMRCVRRRGLWRVGRVLATLLRERGRTIDDDNLDSVSRVPRAADVEMPEQHRRGCSMKYFRRISVEPPLLTRHPETHPDDERGPVSDASAAWKRFRRNRKAYGQVRHEACRLNVFSMTKRPGSWPYPTTRARESLELFR